MERTITAPSELPGGLDVDAREAAKRARIAKQKAARERRQKKVLEAGDDRLAVVSGEKSTESLSRTSSKEEVHSSLASSSCAATSLSSLISSME